MSDHYIEVLVKRNAETSIKKRKLIIRICLVTVFLIAFFSAIPLFYFLTLMIIIVYYFAVVRENVEFEYFYMDGELDIAKVINQKRRKKVISIKDEMIRMVAPINSDEINDFLCDKLIDCVARDPQILPYAIVCSNQGKLQKVLIQMEPVLLREFQKRLSGKVIY